MATTLSSLPPEGLPRELVSMINQSAQDQSLVARLSGDPIPMGYGETSFLTSTKEPEVRPVTEGTDKQQSSLGYDIKTVHPQKFATIVVVSEEFAKANIDGVYDRIVSQLSAAAARGLDLAILHGRNAWDGSQLALATESGFVSQTTNEVDLPDTPGADVTNALLRGYGLVADEGFDFTAFGADPRFRPTLIQARDANGNPTYQSSLDLSSDMGSLLGLPVAYNRTVSGRSRRDVATVSDLGIRSIGGDWNQIQYGFADRIRVKTSDTATVDGVSMFQTNQIALLVEFTMGYVVHSPEAFVKYVQTPDVAA